MAATLTFRSQQFGDGVVIANPMSAPLTPPEPVAGLWRPTGTINTDSVNMLFSLAVEVHIKRNDQWLCAATIEAIRQQQGQRGTLIVTENAVVKVRAADWVLMNVGDPQLQPGYGGRFTASLPLLFSGDTPWLAA